jgi:orotate phosphoribosyltransferase
MNVTFDIPARQRGKVTLSSGGASTIHADFFNAWNQEALAALVKRCINQVPPSKPRPEVCRA